MARKTNVERLCFSVPEVALQLGKTPDLIRDLVREGKLHAITVGKRPAITREELDRFLQRDDTANERSLPEGN